MDALGRPSTQYVGQKATVVINPTTGRVITVHPTHTKLAERLLKKKLEEELRKIQAPY